MSPTIATALPDPRFDAARKHAETARKGLRLTVAACVALGLELIKLKEEIGTKHGGARGASLHDANLKWPELVAREIGFSYVRCQDFMKAAKAVRERLGASRKKGEKEVKLVVQSPPSAWTDEDYDAFSRHINDAFKADTFKGLMGDLGFGPKPAPEIPESDGQGDFYDSMMAAHDCVATPIIGLQRTRLNPAEFTRYLYDLPLDDTEHSAGNRSQRIHGLRTLRHILTQAGEEIDLAITTKTKQAKAPTPEVLS